MCSQIKSSKHIFGSSAHIVKTFTEPTTVKCNVLLMRLKLVLFLHLKVFFK